jgi:hypothetical protein
MTKKKLSLSSTAGMHKKLVCGLGFTNPKHRHDVTLLYTGLDYNTRRSCFTSGLNPRALSICSDVLEAPLQALLLKALLKALGL